MSGKTFWRVEIGVRVESVGSCGSVSMTMSKRGYPLLFTKGMEVFLFGKFFSIQVSYFSIWSTERSCVDGGYRKRKVVSPWFSAAIGSAQTDS